MDTRDLSSHIQSIPKINKAQFISSYVHEQMTHAITYASQGRALERTWDNHQDKSESDPSQRNTDISSDPRASKRIVECGFETPVLKPRRVTDRSTKVSNPPKSSNGEASELTDHGQLPVPSEQKTKRNQKQRQAERPSQENSRPPEKAKGGRNKAEKLVLHENEKPNYKDSKCRGKRKRTCSSEPNVQVVEVTQSKTQSGRVIKNGKAECVINQDDEHEERLEQRRERKRAKRMAMKPISINRSDHDKESLASRSNKKKTSNAKNKALAGLALMHGFTTTNVGTGRLTVKPALNVGVFTKGKASARSRPTQKGRNRSKKGQSSEVKVHRPPLSLPNAVKRLPKTRIQTMQAAAPKGKLQRRSHRTATSDRKEASPAVSDIVYTNKVDLKPAESIIWDIELTSATLPSHLANSESGGRSVIVDAQNAMWNKFPPNEEIVQRTSHSSEPAPMKPLVPRISLDKRSSPSVGPSDSVSQSGLPAVCNKMTIPQATSRYFSAVLDPKISPFLNSQNVSNEVEIRKDQTTPDTAAVVEEERHSATLLAPNTDHHNQQSPSCNSVQDLQDLHCATPHDYVYSDFNPQFPPPLAGPSFSDMILQPETTNHCNEFYDYEAEQTFSDTDRLSFHHWHELESAHLQESTSGTAEPDLMQRGDEIHNVYNWTDYDCGYSDLTAEVQVLQDSNFYSSENSDGEFGEFPSAEYCIEDIQDILSADGGSWVEYAKLDAPGPRTYFREGKALLLGCSESQAEDLHRTHATHWQVSTAEADVAKRLRNHWLPQRLVAMSYKENTTMGSNQSAMSIKPEPRETVIVPLTRSDSINTESNSNAPKNVKPEPLDAAHVFLQRGLPVPAYIQKNTTGLSQMRVSQPDSMTVKDEDIHMEDATNETTAATPKQAFFKVYTSPDDISYSPEGALKEGLGMVASIKASLKHLKLGSQLRQEVWLRELDSLTSQGAPTTLIAVCGATGAGKSSILNAILDDTIVPTSGMRACTAVITEISYHNKHTVDADISFLSEAEWREELAILLSDLVDEDGNIKRSTDLKSDAGIAWSKVHAVYPTITHEQLVMMSADQIIAKDPNIARILGTTKNIIAPDSKSFAKQIGKYIDSKDQKRGDKKKEKEKKGKSLMDKVREASGTSRKDKKDKKADADAPALWPLIRLVNVRCNAAALSTGAILVDLPGVADANAARNNIAKEYMKKCQCIWILAPITRAVDDKTARDLLGDAFKMQLMMGKESSLFLFIIGDDLNFAFHNSPLDGNYDDHAITFIASKCDDISCSEAIRSLDLEDEPELEGIEERLESFNEETSKKKKAKAAAEKSIKALEKELKSHRAILSEYRAHLDALEEGKHFTPRLTGKTVKPQSKSKKASLSSKKRKNARGGKKGSSKRLRSSDIEDDDDLDSSDSDSDSDASSENDSESDESGKDSDDDSDDESTKSDAESGSGSDEDDAHISEEEVTQGYLKEKIKETKDIVNSARGRLSKARREKKDANDALATLKKNIAKAQREKNAFCSLRRSEYSKDVLKEDFRVGLKDLDDAAAEERDPANFNPNQNLRDYAAIDLPVFTCSSRDYGFDLASATPGQVKGDGEPTCFSNAKDTGIPALQQWCHQLTVSSRERSARNFLAHLKTFATSIQSYVLGIGEVTVADREDLRKKWESSGNFTINNEDDEDGGYGGWESSDDPDPYAAIFGDLGGNLGAALYSMNRPKPAPKVDEYGHPVGIAPRLAQEFSKSVDKCVKELQEHFKDGLEDKCKVGAANAASAAVKTTDEFAGSMHWATYRATLRRHGSFRRDLNMELIAPFTRNIALSWSKVFESDLFAPFEASSLSAINKLLKDIEESAAQGLKDRTRIQGDQCLEEARVALRKTMDLVRETMNTEQKEISRCMAPHVQAQLVDGYDRAMEERGTGSVARQKAYFHDFMDNTKDDIFDDGADIVMDRLTKAADAVGETLDTSLGELAQKIEVNLSVLWEGTRDDPAQVKARQDIMTIVKGVLDHVGFWATAQEAERFIKKSVNDDAMFA
ncbi:hypothetical protein H0H93_005415 [Arthromyces matolae]|nr:hypothetical protein H0H93_005415 [Arthromyces matolae]